jgi:hypothetical protein
MTELGPIAWPPAPIRTERLVLREPEARDRAALIGLFTLSRALPGGASSARLGFQGRNASTAAMVCSSCSTWGTWPLLSITTDWLSESSRCHSAT